MVRENYFPHSNRELPLSSNALWLEKCRVYIPKNGDEHLANLDEVFAVLRKYKLCLNASKCSFSVGLGNFWVT